MFMRFTLSTVATHPLHHNLPVEMKKTLSRYWSAGTLAYMHTHIVYCTGNFSDSGENFSSTSIVCACTKPVQRHYSPLLTTQHPPTPLYNQNKLPIQVSTSLTRCLVILPVPSLHAWHVHGTSLPPQPPDCITTTGQNVFPFACSGLFINHGIALANSR